MTAVLTAVPCSLSRVLIKIHTKNLSLLKQIVLNAMAYKKKGLHKGQYIVFYMILNLIFNFNIRLGFYWKRVCHYRTLF